MRNTPVFSASFPAKINVFRRNRPIWFPISCCFFMKVNHIWCPPPASPSVTPFTRFWSRFGGSAHRGEIQTSWISSLRHASREIKTSCIGAGRNLTEWDQDLANSSPSECRRRDQNLVYTLLYIVYIYCLSWDQNLVNQVSLGEIARSKPRKSCQKRQVERSKPRE